MNRDEFRRRISVYVQRDLPDLADQRERIGESLAIALWPMVGNWLAQADTRAELLDWLDERIATDCPRGAAVISDLKIQQSGADGGPLHQYVRP